MWFIRPTQTQLCLPKCSALISVLCKSKGRLWAQWEIHVGPLTRAELSINNWACKLTANHCSGLCLLKAAKLLLIAAASSCQLSSEIDQLPQITLDYFKPIPSFFPRNWKVSFPETVSIMQLWTRQSQEGISRGHGGSHAVFGGCSNALLPGQGPWHNLEQSLWNHITGTFGVPWKGVTRHVFHSSRAGMFLSFPLFTFPDWSQF